MDSVRCPICDDALETEQHVFVSCILAVKIWKDILNWWNIKDVDVSTLDDANNLAGKVTIKASHIKFFDVVVQTTLWLLWRYHNEFVFSAKRPKIELLLNDVKFLSFNWITNRHKNISINWIEWFAYPCSALPITL
ncbi:hypothetical protein Tco_1225079 [Tanacetum coccineum]